MKWIKKSQQEIKDQIFEGLKKNVNYENQNIIGLPASFLDEKVFSQDKFNLNEAPFLSTLLLNPNNIGCHTRGSSESFFEGTQQIEREVIEICAESILKGNPSEFDGYVASGGTEANIEALWVYRNYFQIEKKASINDIAIICSEDSHYSMDKGANLLNVPIFKVKVDFDNREISKKSVRDTIVEAKSQGIKHFIVVSNMMTTMFGSVDSITTYTDVLEEEVCDYKLHVDGAYGGFYFPFSKNEENNINFSNINVSSVTLDAHKMAQAPYGTGIFLIRKGLIHYATTKEASYVEGEDCTLIGSRSGANAVAIWMILSTYGPNGWAEKILVLQNRADLLCEKLKKLNVQFYRHLHSNIVTIKSEFISEHIAQEFGLIPDNHHSPKWFKIVVMEHVTMEKISSFLVRLEEELLLDSCS
jgi:glutamate/tyrosine decarboxylase-like PLP-dependent enzyme